MTEVVDYLVWVITNFSDILIRVESAWAHAALGASIMMAVLPQGKTASAWDKIRTAINKVAVNTGNARNERKK